MGIWIPAFAGMTCIIALSLLLAASAWADTHYWVNVDGNNSWNDGGNWSAASGGVGGLGVPGNNDDVIFDNGSDADCNIDVNERIETITIDAGYDGTITQTAAFTFRVDTSYSQAGGTFTGGTNTIDLNGSFSQTGGTFTGGSGTIDLEGTFTLNGAGATFTSTSGTFKCGSTFTLTNGTFNHGNGTVQFDKQAFTITPGTTEFNNVTFNKGNRTFTIAGGQNLIVNGTLTLTNGKIDGSVYAKGDISLGTGSWDGGDGTLTANGTGAQTLTGGGASGNFVAFEINKGGGTLTLADTIQTGKDWTYTAGTVDAGTSTVVFAVTNLTISPGTMEFNNVTFNKGNRTFTITAGQSLIVNGTTTVTNGKVGGTVNAKGDVVIGSSADGGTGPISLTGTGSQTITGNSGGKFPDTLDINKTSGTTTAIITGTCDKLHNITVTAGTLDFDGGFTYTIDDADSITVSSGAEILFTGSNGNLVTLRSDHGSRTWDLDVNANANYTASYVDVEQSDASPGQYIYASDSTDSGSNVDWYFIDKIVYTAGQTQTIDTNEVSAIITIQLQNNDGEQNVPEDYTINLTTTSGGGHFYSDAAGTNEITNVTIPSGGNSASFYYKDSNAGTPAMGLDEDPDRGWDAEDDNITITALSYFEVNVNTPQIAGTVFNVEVIARKADGITATGYGGGATLTIDYISPTTGAKALEGSTTIASFTEGVATTSVHYDDAGTITITATDDQGLGATGTSSDIVVRPNSFTVVPNDTVQEAGTDFTLTITGMASNGETTPNYSGAITLSTNYVDPTTGTETLSATTITAASFTNGAAELTDANYADCGTITITATDSTYVTGVNITGTSENILFRPASFEVTLSAIPATRTFYYIDEPFDIAITAKNANDATTPNYRGTISITNASKVGLSTTYAFTATDAGVHIFEDASSSSEASFTIGVSDSTYSEATGESGIIDIEYGEIAVISTSGPVGTVQVTVKIRDSEDEVITSDDSTTFTVSISEIIENESASSAATTSAVTVTDGVATIAVTDEEAETVTLVPTSTPELEAISGTVAFGTVSGSGVGVELWREIRKPEEYEQEE